MAEVAFHDGMSPMGSGLQCRSVGRTGLRGRLSCPCSPVAWLGWHNRKGMCDGLPWVLSTVTDTADEGDTAQGVPRRSLSPELILPNQTYVASSDGIACFFGGITVSRLHMPHKLTL